MAAQSLTSAALIAALEGGLIREDVMEQITDISEFPLTFTDLIGRDSHKNEYCEWTKDELAAQNLANATVDGTDQDNDDTKVGTREGNHSQTSVKQVKVSHRADASDTIGRAKETTYQINRRSEELRRDVEGIMLNNQPSLADNGDTVAGLAASFQSWLVTNTFRGATGANGGFAATTPTICDAPTPGTKRALTETLVRDAAQAAYEAGGNPDILMSTPSVIRKFSEFMFDDTARVGIQQTQTGKNESPSKAIGSVNVFTSDFGSVLRMTPNRLMPNYAGDATVADMLLVDPMGLRLSMMYGLNAQELGKTGLYENWLMSQDWSLKVLNEAQHAVIADIDQTLAVTA
tara:strand:+ start:1243 stop:2283 length:1041 start_codon:yes stop_codon:yes gene_type:complete